MKRVKYKKLKIQNFLSVGNDTVEIDFQHGLNQIDGRNIDNPERKNAVGKSVAINAHFFALFGETIDKIKGEFVVNFHTKGKGAIELEFDVETNQGIKSYKIKRQVKPSKVELWEGDTDITRDSIANTNKYICELLQTNSAIHRCCDIMTIRDTTPFMNMDSKDKRQFIEDIFSINMFGIMMKDLKKMISDSKKDKDISFAKVSEIEKSLSSLITQKETISIQIKERENVLQKRKNDLDEKINSVTEKIKSFVIKDTKEIQEQIEKYDKAWTKIDKSIAKLNFEIVGDTHLSNSYKTELKKLSGVNTEIKCDKCLQNITHDHIQTIEEQKQTLTKQLEELTLKLSLSTEESDKLKSTKTKIHSKLRELNDELAESAQMVRELDTLNASLSRLQDSRKDLDEDMDMVSVSLDSFDENIESTTTRKDEEQKVLAELQQKLSDFDICKFILGEEGVKSFVVKKLLDLLNNTIEKYLVALGMNVRCKFDEYFEESITTDKGKVFSYKNASGAEKKSLDFACSLSFSDMRRKINQVSSNVEFYDEVFDNALDEKGLDLIMDVLKNRIESHDMSVYVISHRKEMKKHIDGEIIMLEKQNGITKRIIE